MALIGPLLVSIADDFGVSQGAAGQLERLRRLPAMFREEIVNIGDYDAQVAGWWVWGVSSWIGSDSVLVAGRGG